MVTRDRYGPQWASAPAAAREDLALLGRLVDICLGIFACVTLLATIAVALAHLDDGFQINHVTGAWMALAQAARDGLLYLPLFDGEHYGGTRFMPVPIVLHSALAGLTGEYLLSGKLLNLLGAGFLAAMVFVGTAGAGLNLPQRLALIAIVWLSGTGHVAAFSIRNDALPAALQLAAIFVVERRRDGPALIGAGALCALGMLCKLSAIWAPAAIGCYLLFRGWKGLFYFVPATLVPLGLGVLAFNALSDGRMLESIFGLTMQSGNLLANVIENLPRLAAQLLEYGQPAWMLLPFAMLGVATAAIGRHLQVRHLALLFSLAVTVLVYSDIGATWNHLIDLVALVSVTLATFWGQAPRPAQTILGVLILWLVVTMQLTTRTTYTFASDVVAARDYPRWPLGTLVEPGHVMLSEDPYLAVERGERPVVLDGFMFRRIWGARPELAQPLIDRITSGAFDRIVLLVDIETASERSHVFRAHFSPGVWQAIRQHYRLIGTAGSEVRYFVYAPRTGT